MNSDNERARLTTPWLDTAAMEWQSSPAAGVLRKRLFHRGSAESGVVSSIVRYQPQSTFAPHQHPQGEEIFVLEGVFSDEHGDYPRGYHLLNPDGSSHRPFSQQGCLLWVKLRQYDGQTRPLQHTDCNNGIPWQSVGAGVWQKIIYQQQGYPEQIGLRKLAPGTSLVVSGKAELLVLKGELSDRFGDHGTLSYLRWNHDSSLTLSATEEVECYLCQN